MRNYRELEVWKAGVDLVKEIYTLVDEYPASEKYGLSSQITRAAVSIPSNIAEGCSRDSQKEFSRFLQISLGSSFELETQLEISKELGFIAKTKVEGVIERLHLLQKRIQSLNKYAKSQL